MAAPSAPAVDSASPVSPASAPAAAAESSLDVAPAFAAAASAPYPLFGTIVIGASFSPSSPVTPAAARIASLCSSGKEAVAYLNTEAMFTSKFRSILAVFDPPQQPFYRSTYSECDKSIANALIPIVNLLFVSILLFCNSEPIEFVVFKFK